MEATKRRNREWPSMPLIVDSGLYSQDQLSSILRVSANTIIKWREYGLKPINPNTSQNYYLGENIIEAMMACSLAKGGE